MRNNNIAKAGLAASSAAALGGTGKMMYHNIKGNNTFAGKGQLFRGRLGTMVDWAKSHGEFDKARDAATVGKAGATAAGLIGAGMLAKKYLDKKKANANK